MLCEKCRQREATVHLTLVFDRKMRKADLCLECSEDLAKTEGMLKPLASSSISKIVSSILAHDQRYTAEAYEFILEVVALACKNTGRGVHRHASAAQVLDTFLTLALLRFDTNAKRKLNAWGFKSCEDVGEVIFNLIEAGVLGKLSEESKSEFRSGFSFDEAFPQR